MKQITVVGAIILFLITMVAFLKPSESPFKQPVQRVIIEIPPERVVIDIPEEYSIMTALPKMPKFEPNDTNIIRKDKNQGEFEPMVPTLPKAAERPRKVKKPVVKKSRRTYLRPVTLPSAWEPKSPRYQAPGSCGPGCYVSRR